MTITLRPILIEDWHDGPLTGLLVLHETNQGDELWSFCILAEHPESDDLDRRLYRLTRHSADARLAAKLLDLAGDATHQPIYGIRDEFASDIGAYRAGAITAELIVESRDLISVDESWFVYPSEGRRHK